MIVSLSFNKIAYNEIMIVNMINISENLSITCLLLSTMKSGKSITTNVVYEILAIDCCRITFTISTTKKKRYHNFISFNDNLWERDFLNKIARINTITYRYSEVGIYEYE